MSAGSTANTGPIHLRMTKNQSGELLLPPGRALTNTACGLLRGGYHYYCDIFCSNYGFPKNVCNPACSWRYSDMFLCMYIGCITIRL